MKGKALLAFHEGRSLTAYQDSGGHWTIGVGHLLPNPFNPAWKGYTITERQCDSLFNSDILDHQYYIDVHAPWAKKLDEVRYYVVFDMVFNLGIEPFDGDGIKDWPIFVGQLQTRRWAAAANNMRATKWATQVKSRAERLAVMMETGRWPNEAGVPLIR